MSRGRFRFSTLLGLGLALLACADRHQATLPSTIGSGAGRGATMDAPGGSAPRTPDAAPKDPPKAGPIRTGVASGANPTAGTPGTEASAGSTITAGTTAGEAGAGATAGTDAAAGTNGGPDKPRGSTFCGDFPVELLEVPDAGTGTISGCAPRTCTSPKLPTTSDEILAVQRPDAAAPLLSTFTGCTTIEGDLLINAAATASDLTALRCLERVNGTILIWHHHNLVSLDGLESLALVEGDLLIGGPFYNLYSPNEALDRVDALQQLRAVRGTFAIEGSGLASLHGLEGLRATGRSLLIGIVRGLPDLRGFEGVVAVGDHLELGRPEGPRSLAGFDSLTTIFGGFWLSGGIDLVSVGGFPQLSCVGGSFDFAGSEYAYTNDRLRAADGFPKLTRIGGDAWLGPHPLLETASLFGRVEFVGGRLEVRGSPLLSSLDLGALQHAGTITVINNPALDECAVHAVVDPLVTSGAARADTIEGLRACSAPFRCNAGACGF